MPESEGLETILNLRREFLAVKIVAMSRRAAGDTDYLAFARKLGVRRTLSKPFHQAQLVDAVRGALADA